MDSIRPLKSSSGGSSKKKAPKILIETKVTFAGELSVPGGLIFGDTTKFWCEIRSDRRLYVYKAQYDDVVEVISCFSSPMCNVVGSKEKDTELMVVLGGGLSKQSWKFRANDAKSRDEWVEQLTLLIKISQQIVEEYDRRYLWGDLSKVENAEQQSLSLSWKPVAKAKSLKLDSKEVDIRPTGREHEDRILNFFHRFVNHSLEPYDFDDLSSYIVKMYMPVFLQLPTVIQPFFNRLQSDPGLHLTAYWLKMSGIKLGNKYLHNAHFFGDTTKFEKTWKFFDTLKASFPLKKGDRRDDLDILDPLFNKGTIKSLEVLKTFPSGHAPCVMLATYHDPKIEPSKIFMKADDCRPDAMVMVMWHLFTTLWESSGLQVKPKLVSFSILPGNNFGLMEFVEGSCSLRDFDLASLSKLADDEMDEFLATAAGGYIGGFMLGIRDRHEDNLMVKDGKSFYHLDFKHAFNVKTFGIDGCRFAISGRFKAALVARGKWENFVSRTMAAYLVLRRNSQLILNMCRTVFRDLFENERIENELLHAFYLDRTEEQAMDRISALIDSGVVSVKRVLKNVTHEYSPNIKSSGKDNKPPKKDDKKDS